MIEVVASFGDDVVDVRHIADARARRGYRVGRSAGADLTVDVADHELVAWTERGFVVQRAGEAAVEVPRDGLVVRITDAIRVAIRRVEPPAMLPGPTTNDPLTLRCFLLSLALHAVLWGFVETTPPDVGSIEIGLGLDDSYRDMAVAHLSGSPPPKPDNDRDDDSPDHEQRGAGKAAAGDPGRAGTTASTVATGHIRIKRRDDTRQITREEAIEQARQAGFLGAGGSLADADGFRALTGSVDPSSGFDQTNIYGALYGGVGESQGAFGVSISGFGRGASCAGNPACEGTIGVTQYGTIGNGRIAGDGWGGQGSGAAGGRGGLLRARKPGVPTVILCGTPRCVIGVGGLDKSIIRRYMRRQLTQFDYCYEKELLAKHDLDGEVVASFLIRPDGTTADVTATGMDDEVARCIAGVIEKIAFPKNDQNTQVHYPFRFRPTAG